jgi:hypothetical protein
MSTPLRGEIQNRLTDPRLQTVTGETGAEDRVHEPRVVEQAHRARTRERTVAPIATGVKLS